VKVRFGLTLLVILVGVTAFVGAAHATLIVSAFSRTWFAQCLVPPIRTDAASYVGPNPPVTDRRDLPLEKGSYRGRRERGHSLDHPDRRAGARAARLRRARGLVTTC
jgi:hypothetical protein